MMKTQSPPRTRPVTRKARPTVNTNPARRRATPPPAFSLRLFVAGHTPKSERAFANLTALCEKHLKGRYQVEVIDLLENPHLARGNQIVAIPTLEVKLPQRVQRIIGDLSDTDRVLVGLSLNRVE